MKKMSKVLPLFGVIVLDLIGFGVVMPILPFYAEQYGANATVLGSLLAVYALMQFFFAPFWGRLSDRLGRRAVLIITVIGGGISLVILGLAHSLVMIFIARILSGVCAANISVATAYVGDVTDERNRASGMGMIGAAFGIGFVMGPALAGVLSPYGYSVPIFVAAALNLINVLQIIFRLPEPERHHEQLPTSTRRQLFAIPLVRRMSIMNFFFTMGITQLESVLAFFLMDAFGYDAHHVAYLFVYIAVIMTIVQGGLIRRLKRVPEQYLLQTGVILLAVALLFLPRVSILSSLLIVLAMLSFGRGIAQPAMLSIVSKGGESTERGGIMGTYQSAASLARVVAPALAGFMYDRHHWLPFAVGGILVLVTGVLGRSISSITASSDRLAKSPS